MQTEMTVVVKMKKELEKLTRKYFINQKIEEVCKFVFFTICFFYIPWFIGQTMYKYNPQIINTPIGLWINGIMGILWLSFFIFIIYLVVKMTIILISSFGFYFDWWIESNWKKAEKRAKEKLKCQK